MKKYEYYLKDETLGFENGIEILKSRYADKIFVGWPSITYSQKENSNLISELNKYKVQTEQIEILREEYDLYIHKVNYREKYPNYYPSNYHEKTFEHFLAFKLLNQKKDDKFIDIGAENSPHADIFSKLTGCHGYVQDIMLKPGIHGKNIGCDASMIPVKNGFFNSILVACAIEHFENDSDIKFVQEASRILKSHGKILILPLYLHNHPFYVTDPIFSVPGNVDFSENLKIYCVKDWGNRQALFYSPQTLHNRLIEKNSKNIEFKVIYIKNFHKIDPSIYCRFALLGTKK
ncbi:MAG: hypothetical protein A2Y65_03095 [Deltaproteobacteria bacterium RBG_13_52_11]|nr:MAG: hypothetical protein A2Y65_03095 [Deltaproteobacteria bacterium RBG_13_52_11]